MTQAPQAPGEMTVDPIKMDRVFIASVKHCALQGHGLGDHSTLRLVKIIEKLDRALSTRDAAREADIRADETKRIADSIHYSAMHENEAGSIGRAILREVARFIREGAAQRPQEPKP